MHNQIQNVEFYRGGVAEVVPNEALELQHREVMRQSSRHSWSWWVFEKWHYYEGTYPWNGKSFRLL